jgi:hypothetical protein
METEEAKSNPAHPETSAETEANTLPPIMGVQTEPQITDFHPTPLSVSDPNAAMQFAMSRKRLQGRTLWLTVFFERTFTLRDNAIHMVNQGGSVRWNETDTVAIVDQ